jgi:hypothetical protein
MGWGTGGHKGPNKRDKGHYQGSCNVKACQREGATWYNRAMQLYYCEECARHQNADPVCRRDTERIYGVGELQQVPVGHPAHPHTEKSGAQQD